MKNYNRFDDIQDVQLRVYNRVMLMANLLKDFGPDASIGYAGLFNDSERKQMYIMQQYILQKGTKETKKAITREMEFSGYDAETD